MDQEIQANVVCIMNSRHAWTLWDSVSKQTKKKLEKEWAMNSGLYLYFKLSWGRKLLVDQIFSLSCWPGNSQRSPRQCRLLESLVDSQKTREWDYIAEESYTLHTGLRKVMIELKWKLPPCWLHFIVLDVSLQATEGKKSTIFSWVSHVIILNYLVRHAHWLNSAMNMLGLSSCPQTAFMTYSTSKNTCGFLRIRGRKYIPVTIRFTRSL